MTEKKSSQKSVASKKPVSQKSKKKPSVKADKTASARAESPKDHSQSATHKKEATHVSRPALACRTFFAARGNDLPKWRVLDAKDQPLGRLSSRIATLLMGKDKPQYTRSTDMGDYVIVINAEKVLLTGSKWTEKVYQYHTNYPGGLKTIAARDLLRQHPERLIERAVHGMLPKGHMGRHWFGKLKIYVGNEHPHTAQNPINTPVS
ncbi:MAG: 50S ribosomal protein L13 [Deltaproteobacteria bacterium]|nr:50S ribosomal protein L13 [Deltaproteobacteria bacterium]